MGSSKIQSVLDAGTLEMLFRVFDEALQGVLQGSLPLSSAQESALRERLTETILESFVPGMHEPAFLKRLAIAKVRSGNWLLASMPAENFELLKPALEPVELQFLQILEDYDQPFSHMYFPCDGVASIVARDVAGRSSEVGMIGREGVTGTAALSGDTRSPNRCFMQVAGAGYRLSVDAMEVAVSHSRSLHNQLLRYLQALGIQISQTALANSRSKSNARLARWLLMAHDRVSGDVIELTHELLALMLGIRRSGVTEALHELEGRRLIKASRRKVLIIDRTGLEAFARGCYGVPEREYERLLNEC